MAHGGRNARDRIKKEEARIYDLERFQDRMDKLEDHTGLKTLTAEIAIIRMLVEKTINRCKDDHELVLKSQSISYMVASIERLVTSCTKLDKQLGSALDETQAIKWVEEISEIINKHVPDSEIVGIIVEEMITAYNRIKGEQNELVT